jgi:hypothetical protein
MPVGAFWDHPSRSKRAVVEALEVKLRDFLIVICLVAVMALFFKNLNDIAPHTAQTNEVAVTPPLTGTPTPESVDVPAPTKSSPKERTVTTGFRIKRITASVLADNTSEDDINAIAGFVTRTDSSEEGHPLHDFRKLEIDGIRWATYEEKWLVSILGKPARSGSLDYKGERYHRWSWPNKRELFLLESKDGLGLIPYKVIGRELSVTGSPLLSTGDPKEKAEKLLGKELRYYNHDGVLAVDATLNGNKVDLITFYSAVGDLPHIPLSQ